VLRTSSIVFHGYAKQGSGYGHSGVRGLNALLAAVSMKDTAPVVLAQRLRKGAANSARGAKRLITDALSTLKRVRAGERGALPFRLGPLRP
jgi:hypothetical protein